MAAPVFWGSCMVARGDHPRRPAADGGRIAKLGSAGVIAFHLLLMLFGWGIWFWCVPALAGAGPARDPGLAAPRWTGVVGEHPRRWEPKVPWQG
jgi:hypothetical protein